MRSLKSLGAAFCATSMLCTINVANAKIFVGTNHVAESVNLIDKDLIESQNNELIAGKKDIEEIEREREKMKREREMKMKREMDTKMKRERERAREREKMMREREMKMKRERERDKKKKNSDVSIPGTGKKLPFSVDCPPENKKLKIKVNKKTGEIVVRFAKGKKFYQGNLEKAVKVFGDTYQDKCVK